MNALKRSLQGLMRAELAIGAVLTLYIIFIMVLEIIMRYIFNNSIVWVQESVMLAFIWVTALGASCAFSAESHIVIDTLVRSLPAGTQRALKVFISLLVLACLLFLASTLPKAITIQNKSRTASLPINFPKGYYYSLPILVAVLGMLLAKIYHLYFEVRDLFGLANPAGYKIEFPTMGTAASGEKVDIL